MKGMLMLHLLLYLVFLTALFAGSGSATGHVAVRAHLTHIDSGRGFTKRDLIHRMAARTRARVDKRFQPLPQPPPPPPQQPQPQPGGGAKDTGVTAWVSRGTVNTLDSDSEYLIHFGIGTPPQPVALTLDTSSDLIWTQCACKSCLFQPFPSLDTSASSTLSHVSCTDRVCAWGGLPLSGCSVNDNMCFYVHSYGNDMFTTGKLSEDTFTFQAPSGSGKPVAMRFGCGMYNTGNFKSNKSGMAGFGRGLLSLPKQLNVTRFSYCFTAINESGNSSVFLGTYGNLPAQAQSTPFARGPKEGPNSSLYYLSLQGVTVGTTRLPFNASTFGLKYDGSGGTIIDSGTGITTFPRAVFRTLRGEFESQMSLPVTDGSTADPDSMLCFTRTSSMPGAGVYVPNLILHLEGADWQLPRENYVLDFSGDNTTCVVINSSGDNGITIIGNFQQQNMHIAYDLGSNKLLFAPAPARCNQL